MNIKIPKASDVLQRVATQREARLRSELERIVAALENPDALPVHVAAASVNHDLLKSLAAHLVPAGYTIAQQQMSSAGDFDWVIDVKGRETSETVARMSAMMSERAKPQTPTPTTTPALNIAVCNCGDDGRLNGSHVHCPVHGDPTPKWSKQDLDVADTRTGRSGYVTMTPRSKP